MICQFMAGRMELHIFRQILLYLQICDWRLFSQISLLLKATVWLQGCLFMLKFLPVFSRQAHILVVCLWKQIRSVKLSVTLLVKLPARFMQSTSGSCSMSRLLWKLSLTGKSRLMFLLLNLKKASLFQSSIFLMMEKQKLSSLELRKKTFRLKQMSFRFMRLPRRMML